MAGTAFRWTRNYVKDFWAAGLAATYWIDEPHGHPFYECCRMGSTHGASFQTMSDWAGNSAGSTGTK
jgi:hypothetical protein